jgi:hypothetical protein
VVSDELLGALEAGSPPVIVQQRVPGHDVRVHTVADRCFATHIRGAEGVDYRFSDAVPGYEAGPVPRDLAARCCAFARQQRLLIAGFDFRVTEDGQWWCLECNPAPTFLPYEMSTGQPIAAALLDAMVPDCPG